MNTELTKVEPQKVSKRLTLRHWITRIAIALMVLGPLTFLVAAIGYKIGLLGLGISFGLLNLKVGPMLLFAGVAFGVFSLLLAFFMKPRGRVFLSLIALLIPLFGVVQLVGVKKKAESLPFIHDITTDTQNPPTFSAVILLEREKTPNVNTVDYKGKLDPRSKTLVAVLQTKSYPDIRPVILEDDPDVVLGQAKVVAKNMGWNIVNEDAEAGRIEATETTFWYGFKDDIVIRVKPSEGGGTVLDIRSISRVGGSDLGANAARIRKFVAAIQK